MPVSKLIGEPWGGYAPAPLDDVSLINGALKFDHRQRPIPVQFYKYAYSVLDAFYPALPLHSAAITHDEALQICLDPDHATKACGYPWNLMGYTDKQSVIASGRTCDCSVVQATLKDELRPEGKDARLFRLQSVLDYVEGTELYTNQNNYIMEQLHKAPVFVKYRSPGLDLSQMYQSLVEHGGSIYDADGSSWDARYPLGVAEIVAAWRARSFASSLHDRHFRYYSQMYNGVTAIGGFVLPMVGQPSGHVNTTVDNSLGNIVAMAFVAYRLGMPLDVFLRKVKFFCCGDDLIWSDLSGQFTPANVNKFYNELGIYLEFTSLSPSPIEQSTFCGTIPVYKNGVLRYHGKIDKLAASLHFSKKGLNEFDTLAKMTSVCMLSFYSDQFSFFKKQVLQYIDEVGKRDPAFRVHPVVASYFKCLDSSFLSDLYNQWEGFGFSLPASLNRCLKEFHPPV